MCPTAPRKLPPVPPLQLLLLTIVAPNTAGPPQGLSRECHKRTGDRGLCGTGDRG